MVAIFYIIVVINVHIRYNRPLENNPDTSIESLFWWRTKFCAAMYSLSSAILLLLIAWHASNSCAFERIVVNESHYWDINTQKGIIRGQNLRLRKLNHPTNPYHTCYEVTCEGRQCVNNHKEGTVTIQICYPLLVVTGLPKCGTSAMYDLLSKFPGAITMHEKENCPSTRRRPHWIYFQSLPRMSALTERSVIIDGCISVINNMKIRDLILHPNTYYIVMMRDFTDMLWSSYNFWCKREFDGNNCDYSKWADPALHHRSPQQFHDLITLDQNRTVGVVQPFYYPMEKPCINAGGYYTEYLSLHLYSRGLQNHTILIASEELDHYPLTVAMRVARIIDYDISGIALSTFKQVRVNTQEAKGATTVIQRKNYQPGLYNISNFQPLLPQSRTLLNQCWKEDCKKIAKLPPYYHYEGCFPELAAEVAKLSPRNGGEEEGAEVPKYRRAGAVFVPLPRN